jgi:hypothetical protein
VFALSNRFGTNLCSLQKYSFCPVRERMHGTETQLDAHVESFDKFCNTQLKHIDGPVLLLNTKRCQTSQSHLRKSQKHCNCSRRSTKNPNHPLLRKNASQASTGTPKFRCRKRCCSPLTKKLSFSASNPAHLRLSSHRNSDTQLDEKAGLRQHVAQSMIHDKQNLLKK